MHIINFLVQVEEQKFEMDTLKRVLEEKIGEIQRIKDTLQTSEKVCISLYLVKRCVSIFVYLVRMYVSVFIRQ